MRRFALHLLTLVLTNGLLIDELEASHVSGAFITYTSIDTNQFILTVNIYRDCRSLQFVSSTVTINYKSTFCIDSGSATLPLITGDLTGNNGTGNFISYCLSSTSCDSVQSAYSIEEFVYQDTITLPIACNDWVISYETLGFRNSNDVLVNATSQKLYVSSMINNVDAPLNNSPIFDKVPNTVFCTGTVNYLDHTAIDSEGDSLVYYLVPPQGTNGSALAYTSLFSPQNPFYYNSPVPITFFDHLDPFKGMAYAPFLDTLTTVISVLIEEYRNNVLIGSIKTDLQSIVSNNCSTDTINFVGDTTASTGLNPAISANCFDNVISVSFDNPIQCTSVAGDGSDFYITDSISQQIQVTSAVIPNCVNGLTDTVILYLADSFLFNGSYRIYDMIGTDNNPVLNECSLPLNDILELRVRNCVTTGLDFKEEDNSTYVVYPNPTTGQIMVTGLTEESERVMVYNVLGELVHDQYLNASSEPEIDLSALPSGLYLIQLEYGQIQLRKKVIKQ